MNQIYAKLQKARLMLQAMPLTKSGKNKFAGYDYFELSDFMPAIQDICGKVGLCGMVSYTHDNAYLVIQDTEAEGQVTFTAPMSTAALKGCHEVQNLGAVISYLRRYLWSTAFELVEHDALDATTGSDAGKPVTKAEPKVEPKAAPKPPAKVEGKTGDWQIVATMKPEGDPQDWLNAIGAASDMALEMATKEDDVMQIFKKNKQLFDAVKAQDADYFKDLMAMFTEAKNKFAE
jgi:hypothetical protein